MSCAKKKVEIDLGKVNLLEVLKEVEKSQQSVKSVKGLASVTIQAPDKRISFNQVTIAEEPNLLHLEALAPFGKVVGAVISDGEKIYVTFPKEKRVFDNAQEFDFSSLYTGLPVKLTVDKLVNLLLGHLAEPLGYDLSRVYLSSKSNYLILTFFKNGKEESVLWVNPLNYRIERANLTLSDGVSAAYRFDDFKDAGSGVFFPKKIELKVDKFFISLKYDDEVEVNGKMDRNSFKPERPLADLKKHSKSL